MMIFELSAWAGLEPAILDIKTVSGLAQVFELTLTDSTGSEADLNGVSFRGAVNTAPLQEFVCAVGGGKLLFGWSCLPAGRHSFDLFVVIGATERALVRGTMVVAGRVVPPLGEGGVVVNDAATLALPDTVDGVIRVELSEAGLVDLLSRRAGFFAGEAAASLKSVEELKRWIGEKVEGFGGVADEAVRAVTDARAEAVSMVEGTGTVATEAVKAVKGEAVQSVRDEKVAAVKAVTDARAEAVSMVEGTGTVATEAVKAKQSEAVLAVGRAQKTATDNVAAAQRTAVAAVGTAQNTATTAITPFVERAETAKDQAQAIAEGLTISAGTVTTGQPGSQASITLTPGTTPGSWVMSAAIPRGDVGATGAQGVQGKTGPVGPIGPQGPKGDTGSLEDYPGHVNLGGLTVTGTINANYGVNIPLAVSPATDTAAVNRLVSEGMAVVRQALAARNWPQSWTTYGSASVNVVRDKDVLELKNAGPGQGSVVINTYGYRSGGSNYGSCTGAIIPFRPSYASASKLSFILGAQDTPTVLNIAQPIDAFSISPKASSTTRFERFVDVTFYPTRDAEVDGFPVRTREIWRANGTDNWSVYTTMAYIPAFNTGLMCLSSIVYQQDRVWGVDAGSLWLVMGGGYSSRRIIKIADLHAVADTIGYGSPVRFVFDAEPHAHASYLFGTVEPTLASNINGLNGAYYAFRSLESDLTQGPATVTDFTPYE